MSLLQEIQEKSRKTVPVIKPGLTIRVHQKIKEGSKERIQVFEGLVIKVNSGHGADKTFTVRKIVEGIGVEKIFPLYSPLIAKIEVKKEAKVRRAKLYYMRERFGKSARLKESFISEQKMEEAIEELAEQKAAEDAEKAEAEGTEAAEAPAEAAAEAPAEEAAEEEAATEAPPAEAATEAPEEAATEAPPAEAATEAPAEEAPTEESKEKTSE